MYVSLFLLSTMYTAPYFTMATELDTSTCNEVAEEEIEGAFEKTPWTEEEEEEADMADMGNGDSEELYNRICNLSGDIRQKIAESAESCRKAVDDDLESAVSCRRAVDDDLESAVSCRRAVESAVSCRRTVDDDLCLKTSSRVSGGKEGTSEKQISALNDEHKTQIGREDTPPDSTPRSSSQHSTQSSEKAAFADPRTQKAYQKMLKLDERLAGLSRREREVKRQRRVLEEKMEEVGVAQPSSFVVSMSGGWSTESSGLEKHAS